MSESSLVVIGYVYSGMFASIWRTRHATPLAVGDSEFALRFFLIVLTDAACWVPIIILKIVAMTKYPVPGKRTLDAHWEWTQSTLFVQRIFTPGSWYSFCQWTAQWILCSTRSPLRNFENALARVGSELFAISSAGGSLDKVLNNLGISVAWIYYLYLNVIHILQKLRFRELPATKIWSLPCRQRIIRSRSDAQGFIISPLSTMMDLSRNPWTIFLSNSYN